MSDDPREVVRCRNSRCLLNQFMTASGNCRKCREALKEPKPIIEPPVVEINQRPLSTGRKFDVGMAIWVLRHGLNLSSKKLAEQVGITRQYVSKIENDKLLPETKMVIRFAEAFEIPAAALIEIAHHVRNGRAA